MSEVARYAFNQLTSSDITMNLPIDENVALVRPRHPSSERFHAVLAECGRLHDAKQADYGRAADPFANVRASAEWGMPAWVGAMVRLNDKVRRLQSLAVTGKLGFESAQDNFKDIIVYGGIAHVLFDEEEPRG